MILKKKLIVSGILAASLIVSLAAAIPRSVNDSTDSVANASQSKKAAEEKSVASLEHKKTKKEKQAGKHEKQSKEEKKKRQSALEKQRAALERETDSNDEIDLHQKTYTKKQYEEILKQSEKGKWKKLGNRRWTSYCPVCNTPANSYASSSGIKLFSGCAASKYFPLGTIIKMKGRIYMITDRCGTDAIDIFHDTPKGCRCNQIGSGYADVYVLLDAGQALPRDHQSENLKITETKSKSNGHEKTVKKKQIKKIFVPKTPRIKTAKAEGTENSRNKAVLIAWTKAKGANRYSLYIKKAESKNASQYIINGTTKSLILNKGTYSVKVRGEKVSKGKIVRGKYSPSVKFKVSVSSKEKAQNPACSVSVINGTYEEYTEKDGRHIIKYSPESLEYVMSRLVIDGTAMDLEDEAVLEKYKDEVELDMNEGKAHTLEIEYSHAE